MIMSQSDSIRDVIAFPKTREASCLLSDAPSTIDKEQLDILGLSIEQYSGEGKIKSETEKETKLDINELEELSELLLNEEERKEIEKELRELIEFTAILKDVNTEGIEPTINIHPIPNATRKDIVEKEFTREELLANAPTVEDGYILVPKVIE